MLLSTARQSGPPRPRRPRSLPPTVERLEARSLLSSVPAIQWKMTPQIATDPAHGSQPELPNTPAYVNPPSGYPLTLDASHPGRVGPGTTFTWEVIGAGGFATYLTGEEPTLSLPQGKYTVKLQESSPLGAGKTAYASTTMTVKDVLIVAIGDSYASGEGNPVVPVSGSTQPAQWAYSPDPAMERENALGHRSTISGPAQFALRLQEANPHEAVTFVSVANSGASIAQGLLGPLPSIDDPSAQLPAEVAEVRQIIGDRKIDALTLSVGGNDVGFVSSLTGLIENTTAGSPSLAAIQAQVDAAIETLPGLDARLGQALKGLGAAKVLVTDYPDLTRNQGGAVAPIVGPTGATEISLADAQFASKAIDVPLNQAIATAAKANRWTLVYGILEDFSTHGYPSTATWVRQAGESLALQGSLDGTFHPNAAGVRDIASRLLAAFDGKNGK